jgi:hypothetical protein
MTAEVGSLWRPRDSEGRPLPAPVVELLRMARGTGWPALARYSSPEWLVRCWQPGRGEAPGIVRLDVAFRLGRVEGRQGARGWRAVRAAESIEWTSTMTTERTVTLREVRQTLRGER